MIIDHIKRNHFEPHNFAEENDLCTFCGKEEDLTKEHVLPKWCFENDPERFFKTVINESKQTFIKTTIPACSTCNNETLSKVENHINNLFRNTDLNDNYYDYEELLDVIRWLEIIEYKFHILNFKRKFIRKQSDDFIPLFRNVPMSIMRSNIELSPCKAIAQLRRSQERIKRKDKESKYYSLVFWKSQNKQPLFFHTMDEHIFFEFPKYQLAMFYFFNKEFESNFHAEKEAKDIILKIYPSLA